MSRCLSPTYPGAVPEAEVGSWRRLRRVWADLAMRIVAAVERDRQRHRLRELDDHLLRDIGITRAQAQAEADKPPWR